ncbi:uncharacterized protein B0H64DRAFT_374236 [Chaetomium fimeti]|uniref:Uncharacterized protein n=1 Tax=Chaetomium fimeti TaxID=1854472 RepID=A0AAE0LTD2_9PEZI|nr:hypothetical protein B0H64DRAFT_374236 [Chaetomium fimeti]
MSSNAGKAMTPSSPQPSGSRSLPDHRPPSKKERTPEAATGTEDSTAEPRSYPENRPRPYPAPTPAPESDIDSESDSSDEELWADAQEDGDGNGEDGDGEGGEGDNAEAGNSGHEERGNTEREDEFGYLDDDFDFGELINYASPAAGASNTGSGFDDIRELLILTSRPRQDPIAPLPDFQLFDPFPPRQPPHRVSFNNHTANPISNVNFNHLIAPPPHPFFAAANPHPSPQALHAQDLHLQLQQYRTRLRAAALRRQMQTVAARHSQTVQAIGYCPGCAWCGRWPGGGGVGSGGGGGNGVGGAGGGGGGGWDGPWAWLGFGGRGSSGGY